LQAEDPGTATNDLHGTFGLRGTGVTYSSGAPRERFTSTGAFLDLDLRAWFGLTVGGDADRVRLLGRQEASPQTNGYGNLRIYLPLGEGGGKLILRADSHQLSYATQENPTVRAHMNGGHLGYLSNVEPLLARCFLDVAFHRSIYPGDFLVDQWTPSLGFGVNGNTDWFSLSGSYIRTRPPVSLGGLIPYDLARAWRGGWTHYFQPGFALKPATFGLYGQGGRRLYAVDPDAGLMVNHGDVQLGGGSAALSWRLGAWSLGFEGGRSTWEPASLVRYTSSYLTTTLKASW
jgi:hypothetical protein